MADSTDQDADVWERTCAHFKDGYKHASEIVKFIDTKTGVITGLLMLTTAMPFAVLKWSASLDEKYSANFQSFQSAHPYPFQIIMAGCVAGIIFGVCGVIFGIEGLSPRSPRKHYHGIFGTVKRAIDIFTGKHTRKKDKPPISVLFPFYKEKDSIVAAKYFNLAAKGMSKKQILQEYEGQIVQVGRILCLKVECNQRAAFCLKIQLWTYLITAVVAYLAIATYIL